MKKWNSANELPPGNTRLMLTGTTGYKAPKDTFLCSGYLTSGRWHDEQGMALIDSGLTVTHWRLTGSDDFPPSPKQDAVDALANMSAYLEATTGELKRAYQGGASELSSHRRAYEAITKLQRAASTMLNAYETAYPELKS